MGHLALTHDCGVEGSEGVNLLMFRTRFGHDPVVVVTENELEQGREHLRCLPRAPPVVPLISGSSYHLDDSL